MFGRFNVARYLKEKSEAGKLPDVEVTRDEFVAMLMAEGESRETAEFQAKICVSLGSSVRIGNQMVSIKE